MITGSFITHNVEETLAFGRVAGEKARPGEVWTLDGPLGGGKTVFAKGLAAGLGFTGPVTSPTFTLQHIYGEGRLPLYHFDWYRLKSASEVVDLGFFEWAEKGGVTLVEWAGKFPALLPSHCIKLTTEMLSESERRLLLEVADPTMADRAQELLLCWPP